MKNVSRETFLNSGERHHVTITGQEKGQRLDRVLATRLAPLSRSRLQSLIEAGLVTRGDATISEAGHKVKPEEVYLVTVPPTKPLDVAANADIELPIVYEDDQLLVINKPAGLTVHPAAGHHGDTLVNALLAHCGDSLSGIGGVARPGIVHRLDKDTSGLMVVAKTDSAHQSLAAQLKDRSLSRVYHAIVWGGPQPPSGKIEGAIGRSPKNRKKMAVVAKGGKAAVTHYKMIKHFGMASLMECTLETGRTHQIRVHFAHKGHSLLGDPVYGSRRAGIPAAIKEGISTLGRQALHAAEIGFIHPVTGKPQRFAASMPDDMMVLINLLSGIKNSAL